MQSLSKSPSVCSFQESQSQSTVTLLLCKTGFLSSPGSAIIPLLPLLRPNINSNYRRLLATIKPFGEEAAHVWPFNLSLGMDQQTTTQMDQHKTTAYDFLIFMNCRQWILFYLQGHSTAVSLGDRVWSDRHLHKAGQTWRGEFSFESQCCCKCEKMM